MLPATLQFVIAMIACAINERMQRKLDYTQEEVRVLKDVLKAATGSDRIVFTADQRRRLAVVGRALSPEERRKCCQIVKPGTILGWFRHLAAQKYDSSKSKVGRPRKRKDIRKLVIDMALENLGWGYTKIRDALRTGLKIEIGRTTVADILAEEGIEPAPEREKKRTWKQFLKSHWDTLYACDFFSVEALGITGTVRYMVFFVIDLKSRAVEIAGIVVDPGEAWMKQVARNLTDPVDGFLRGAKYLIHDRDPLFTEAFIAILEAGGVKSVKIPAQSPNCNPYAERFVKTIKYEGLNQFVIFGERHLRYLIKEFGLF
jgi:putative transposase